jgi:hypothetical protein
MCKLHQWIATRSQMHTHLCITDHRSLTDHYRHISQPPTSMRRPALEGVTCRGVLESHRSRWRRRLLSHSALRSAPHHQRPPTPAQVLPLQSNPLRPRIPRRLRTCPRRPTADQSASGLGMRMRTRRYPDWVNCRGPSSTRLLHAPRGWNSKPGLRPLPLLLRRVRMQPPSLSRRQRHPHLHRHRRHLEHR